jgi:DNA-binding beta-propeller fold protein YncE
VITDTLAEFVLSALPDRDSAHLVEVSGNNQVAAPGEELEEPLVVRLEDQFGNPIESEPVVFARLVGDGEFVDANAVASRRHIRGPTARLGLARPRQTVPPVVSVIVSTDPEGKASVRYRPGEEALQVVSAQAQLAPNDPVIFRINLGPLAGNGTQPINIAVGGGRGYTANSGTNNISVFDATGSSHTVVDVIDLKLVQTGFGFGGISGVAVDALANRLYIYAHVNTSVYGASVVLLVIDTATNELVGPIDPTGGGFPDPDGDSWPGLTLFTTPEPLPRLLDAGNFVTVDATRRRVYAVVPISDDNGRLMVIEDRGDALAIVGHVPVGELPTGVAINSRTNRIYVTNGGFNLSDASNDTMTVINGTDLTVVDTITVGRGPLGVKVDDIHDVIYVANLFGEETLESSGALSVINGETHTVIHIPTAGITDLAVLVDVETDLLDDAIDRIYVNDGRIIDCNITDLTVPTPCQVHPDYSGLGGRPTLALNDARTLLFGANRYDNSVTVFNLATNEVAESIWTGVTVGGLAVDTQTGTTYVSDWLSDRLFVIDSSGEKPQPIDLWREYDFFAPYQVEVDETNDRIYLLSTGSTPLIVLDRTQEQVATLGSGMFDRRKTLGIDEHRNLLYIATASRIYNRLLVFDGTKLLEDTDPNNALVANIVIGLEDGTELAGEVAVDAERNFIYVANCGLFSGGCDPSRNALVVVRGPELDEVTRTVLRAPEVVTEVPGIGLHYWKDRGGYRGIALDPQRNLIYVPGVDSIGVSGGFVSRGITVLDGFKIVDAQGQVVPNPTAAILGTIPFQMRTMLDNLAIPITSDFGLERWCSTQQKVCYTWSPTSVRSLAKGLSR